MSKKLLFRLVVLMAAMMCALGMQAAVEAYANYTPSNTTLTFYYDNQRSTRTGTTYDLNTGYSSPGWYLDGIYTSVTRVVFKSPFVIATPTTTYSWFCDMENLQSITGIAYLNTSEVTNMGWMFGGCSSLKNLDLSSFNTANVSDMRCMFYNCESLMSLDLSHFNTTVVNDMYGMFDHCESLTSLNVSSFNTANVTDMRYMFRNCKLLTSLNVSSFITDNVTSMGDMFSNCCGLTSLDLRNFNTSNVTDMESMFLGCNALTDLDVSSFNTANVTNMGIMFSDCNSLTSLDVSNFNTANVTTMNRMFENCSALTRLDLSSFNTAKVTNMKWMFFDCTNLKTINVGDGWSTAAVTSSDYMFYYCTKLVGGKGTTYDANHIDKEYAHIDGGASDPGYMSYVAPQAYACYTAENTTLTFYYDYYRTGRTGTTGTTYVLNASAVEPCWATDGTNAKVTQVAFDPSFAEVRPMFTCYWFYEMRKLESITGLNYLNTSEVTRMDAMFSRCYKLTSLDLSNFNTSNVTDLTEMFRGSAALRTIYVGDGWQLRDMAQAISRNVFNDCTSLVGGQGTAYDPAHVGGDYAHIDGGPSNPGYFTDKNASQRGDVDGDGTVNIADVTALIDYLLSGSASGVNLTAADCNQDSSVNISDVTSLIDYLLSGTWN